VTDHPVLVPTSHGLLGGIVTEPRSAATAAVLVLQGAETRSGTNRIWAQLARTLADLGAVVLRLDYPGRGDSDPQPDVRAAYAATRPSVREAVAWFGERAGGLELMLIGTCYGGRVALDLAADLAGEKPRLRAVGLVTPHLRTPPSTVARAAQVVFGPSVRAVRKVALRSSRTYTSIRDRVLSPRDPAAERMVAAAAQSAPVWILVGDQDAAAREAFWFASQRSVNGRLSVETVPSTRLHAAGEPMVREEVLARVVSWARQQLDERTRV